MDFKKLVKFIEENKNEHFNQVVAGNKQILAENKAHQKKGNFVHVTN